MQLGIDVDRGGRELDRWFLAATLFGNRISARIAMRTYEVLSRSGVATIGDVRGRSWEELVALLDEGGYVRYDFRTATRLQALAAALPARSGDGVAALLHDAHAAGEDPRTALEALPGWGPITVELFLREVDRGPRALDRRACEAAAHLGLTRSQDGAEARRPTRPAMHAGLDPRDLEAALERLWMAHARQAAHCPGGARCAALDAVAEHT